MGIASSLVIFAAGAVLRFAVAVNSIHFNVHTIGVILMIVGAVGLVLSLIFWTSWGGLGGYRRERTIIEHDPVYRDRSETVYYDRELR
jgi:hypothetical protein